MIRYRFFGHLLGPRTMLTSFFFSTTQMMATSHLMLANVDEDAMVY